MKITEISREISHKLNVGGYETIAPTIRMTAILDDAEDKDEGVKQLSRIVEEEWAKIAIQELRQVLQRRGDITPKDDKVPQLMGGFKGLLNG